MTPDDQATDQPSTTTPPLPQLKEETLRQVVGEDYLVLRWAVIGLIMAIMVSLLGVFLLTLMDKTFPDGVIAVGSTAVGALATMLVRPPSAPSR